jgi:hypothetical protein
MTDNYGCTLYTLAVNPPDDSHPVYISGQRWTQLYKRNFLPPEPS